MLRKLYFIKRNGQFYTKQTKQEIYNIIDNNNPNTFLPFLEEMDYPYLEQEWEYSAQRKPESCLGFYIAKMRLMSFRSFGYADSAELNHKWRRQNNDFNC